MIAMADEDGFSGLEAAIILIAFIVVATAFSYVVLGAGFSASEKARMVTGEAGKTTSALVVTGSVVGQADEWGNKLKHLSFSSEVIGESVPASGIRYSLITTDSIVELSSQNAKISWNYELEADGILSRGEVLSVELTVTDAELVPGTPFALTLHPPEGIPVSVRCQVPGSLTPNKYYMVG